MSVYQCFFLLLPHLTPKDLSLLICYYKTLSDYAAHFLMIHKNKTAFWPSLISKGTLSSILTVNFLLANDMAAYQFEPIKAGSILESKDMHAIFQKKGKKGQNILKFGQKCAKF